MILLSQKEKILIEGQHFDARSLLKAFNKNKKKVIIYLKKFLIKLR